jgi:hypothetical protein
MHYPKNSSPVHRGTDERSKYRRQIYLHYALQGGGRRSQSACKAEGFIPHSSSKKKILPHNSLNSYFTLIFPSYTKSTIYCRFSLIIIVRRNIQHLHTNRVSRTFINNHIFLLKSLFSCYKSCLFWALKPLNLLWINRHISKKYNLKFVFCFLRFAVCNLQFAIKTL